MAPRKAAGFLFLMLAALADTLVIFIAASLTKPMQPALDTFSARTGIVVLRESGGSLEHARKVTELQRIPDLLLLADADVFPRLLSPRYTTWFAEFARNRMVVAYTAKSKHASDITSANWYELLRGKDVEVGRTDPDAAPVGYRTVLMLQLAERHYRRPGLAKALEENAPKRNMRANAAELAALLAAGELDYIYEYQSVAESNGFRFVRLPGEIDLGDPNRAAAYHDVATTVRGSSPGTSMTVRGEPILYGMSIPTAAPHAAAARRFLEYLMTPDVLRQLRAAHVDMLDHAIVVGPGAPPELTRGARR
ncbi:MAG TPA: extracellular solute-binding protein [Gemmatimonadaceae bacterium]|nr:extracellular solute-binding protein [Gemmatimonadaceae bacterium]